VHISLVGISHKTAPVAVRERFALNGDEVGRALALLGEAHEGAAVLSTCNRTEVYVIGPAPVRDPSGVIDAIARARGQSPPEGGAPFYVRTGRDAVRHLFRVAAGIESMVVGEAEILGQVRSAFAAATAARTHNAVLSRLFHSAIRVGRRARNETGISRHAVSVSSTAVALARKTVGDLSSRTVLVVSAGGAGKLAARSLAEAGIRQMLVTSRTFERARELASDLGAAPVPFNRLDWALGQADIVITSTGASEFLIGPELLRASRNGDNRPLLLIDIAVPRDVDPSVRELSGVHLFDIDDLRSVARENMNARRAEIQRVEAIVEEELARFSEWLRSLQVVPTIAALRKRAEAIQRAELERTLPRLNLSEDARRRVEAMSAAIVKRLLHDPILRLKQESDGERYVAAVRELFRLEPGVAADSEGEEGA
jgi:glutamyl-tRNA reductase